MIWKWLIRAFIVARHDEVSPGGFAELVGKSCVRLELDEAVSESPSFFLERATLYDETDTRLKLFFDIFLKFFIQRDEKIQNESRARLTQTLTTSLTAFAHSFASEINCVI